MALELKLKYHRCKVAWSMLKSSRVNYRHHHTCYSRALLLEDLILLSHCVWEQGSGSPPQTGRARTQSVSSESQSLSLLPLKGDFSLLKSLNSKYPVPLPHASSSLPIANPRHTHRCIICRGNSF